MKKLKTSYTKQARDHFRKMNFIGIGFTQENADEEIENKKVEKVNKDNPELALRAKRT